MIRILLLTAIVVMCIGLPYIAWAIFGNDNDDSGEYNQPSTSTAISRR